MSQDFDLTDAKRGPVIPSPPGTTPVTLRLDDDVIDWFRGRVNQAGGGEYGPLINAALRDHIHRNDGRTLEETLRRVLRDERSAAG